MPYRWTTQPTYLSGRDRYHIVTTDYCDVTSPRVYEVGAVVVVAWNVTSGSAVSCVGGYSPAQPLMIDVPNAKTDPSRPGIPNFLSALCYNAFLFIEDLR